VLKKLPVETQTDVTGRIAMMGRTLPETLRAVEKVLEEQMRVAQSADFFLAGGIDAVSEILGVVDRGTERHVLESLERQDPELAEAIKRRMLVFEDIVLLVDEDVAKVLKEVTEEDLLLALKSVVEVVRAKAWASLGRAKAEALQASLAQMGRVRLRDVEAAQQRIVGVIRQMEEEGKIEIARAGESKVVG
jgi:flagellar motor switch protein FliG